MGVTYLWDTNTAIYYLQQQFPQKAEQFIDQILIVDRRPCISVITEIELLCWKAATNMDMKVVRDFIKDALIIELDEIVKPRKVEIRKKHKVKLPDAIIAASALAYNLSQLTRNLKDFDTISELSIINPWEK